MRITAPSMSTLLASETCGTPSRSASIAASTPILASVDSDPQMTRSKPVWPRTCASAYEVDRASAGQPVVQQVHGLVRAHRQRLADRLGGLLRAHGQDGDLGLVTRLALRLGDLQALLDGVLVKLVDEPVHRRAVHRRIRRLELALGRGIWHLLDAHDDVHGLHRPPWLLAYSLPNRTAPFGTGSTAVMLLAGSKSPGRLAGQEEAARDTRLFQLDQLFNCFSYFVIV